MLGRMWMGRVVTAQARAVVRLELHEDDRREDGHQAERDEGLLCAMDHRVGMRMHLWWHEEGGDQRGAGDAEAHRHLLHVLAIVLALLVSASATSA